MIACYLLKTLTSYPLSNFPLRVTLHYALFRERPTTVVQHVLETVLPFAVALGIALVVTNVSVLFSFVGAVARTSISFLYPAAILLRSSAPVSGVDKALCWVVIVFGSVITVLGLAATILFVA